LNEQFDFWSIPINTLYKARGLLLTHDHIFVLVHHEVAQISLALTASHSIELVFDSHDRVVTFWAAPIEQVSFAFALRVSHLKAADDHVQRFGQQRFLQIEDSLLKE